VRGSGLDPAALEFIDSVHAKMLSSAEGVELGDKDTLFMEFHAAHEATLQMGIETVREICSEFGALSFHATTDPTERKRLWQARHHSYEILKRTYPGKNFLLMDVAVPISAYPELIAYVRETLKKYDAVGYLIGHAGDGNIHVELPFDDAASYEKGKAVNEAVVYKALDLGGTSTGEHGVGIGKAPYMAREHGTALEVMRSVKQLLDPKGILNPGKIFPTD
jgi:D-lactate dehydrogenase (cytochrome)